MNRQAAIKDPNIRRALRRRRRVGSILNSTTSFFNAWFSYICVFTITLLFSVFYLQTFFYFILALLLCFPVISYNLSKRTFNGLIPELTLSPSSCGKGTECELEVAIDNPSILPVSCFEFTIEFRSLFYGGDPPATHSLQIKSHSKNVLSFPVSFNKCGIYTAKITDIRAFDYLHLFSFKKAADINASLTVMPSKEPSEEDIRDLETEGFDEFTDTDRRGNHSANVTDIREYIPGDRLSRIHWKLTEKLDKLIVKENEATSSNEFTVLLELYQPSAEECIRAYEESGGTDDSLCRTLDKAIEEAWSVSSGLIAAGEQFNFMFYDKAGDFSVSRIGCTDDLTDIMTRAFYSGCYDTKDLALSVYNAAGLNKGTLIHVG